MFAIWLHTVGARIIALPFRIVIGLVFINQGRLNMSAGNGDENGVVPRAMLLELDQYGLGGGGAAFVGALLIIAGIAAMAGILVRPIGAVLFVVVLTNLFVGLGDADTITLLQNRMLLAMCSLVLFFLGSGIFSLDNLIFRRSRDAIKKSNEEAMKKAKG